MITAEDLALNLGMLQPDDVIAVLQGIAGDLHDEEIPDELAGEIGSVLNPNGERTALAGLYWPGHEAELHEAGDGIGMPIPTRGEGFYPPL